MRNSTKEERHVEKQCLELVRVRDLLFLKNNYKIQVFCMFDLPMPCLTAPEIKENPQQHTCLHLIGSLRRVMSYADGEYTIAHHYSCSSLLMLMSYADGEYTIAHHCSC